MKTIERPRIVSVALVATVSIAALACAAASGCTNDMTIGGALGPQGPGGTGGTGNGGTGTAGTGAGGGNFACGSQTCVVGRDFCLMGPTDPGHCVPLPTACAGTSSCGCVCQTAGGGPGFCADPAQFNYGQGQCSCQNVGATTDVAVWCSLPATSGSAGNGGSGGGGTGGSGGTVGTGGASGGSGMFPCGTTTCNAGTEFCVIDPALTHCMPLPQNCTSSTTASACGCACQTQSGGPGTCPNPGQFNEGNRQCSCQNAGATMNAVVYCQ